MSKSGKRVWTLDPHSGGVKIPDRTKRDVQTRLQACFAALGHDKAYRLEVRFRGALCYIDAYKTPDPGPSPNLVAYWESQGWNVEEGKAAYRQEPTHLGRLRHFAADRWSYAFYTYSNERYEATVLDGDWFGTPEQALAIGCIYLHE